MRRSVALLLALTGGFGAPTGCSSTREVPDVEARMVRAFADGNPVDLAWAGPRLAVLDSAASTVALYADGATPELKFGEPGSGPGQIQGPLGLAADDERILVADTGNDRIQVFDHAGNFLRSIGGAGAEEGEFQSPHDVAFHALRDLVVADTGNDRVQFVDGDGAFLAEVEIQSPRSVLHTHSSGVYVTSGASGVLRRVTPGTSSPEPMALTAVAKRKGGLRVPGDLAERWTALYMADRDQPLVLEFSDSWILLRRIVVSAPARAIAVGDSWEAPSLYTADGRQVIEWEIGPPPSREPGRS